MRETDREPQLPPTTIRRWTIRRKAALLEALRSGALTVEGASQRYALSLEELRAWERDLDRTAYTGCARPDCRSIEPLGAVRNPQLNEERM
jgi:hypothetical protein